MENEKKKEPTRKRRKTSEPPPVYESTSEDEDDDSDHIDNSKRNLTDFEHFYRGFRAQVEQAMESGDDCRRDDNENDYTDNYEIFEDNVSILNAIIRINDKIIEHKKRTFILY